MLRHDSCIKQAMAQLLQGEMPRFKPFCLETERFGAVGGKGEGRGWHEKCGIFAAYLVAVY